MAQQALRRHDDERISPSPQNLAPQAVEQLDRQGRLDDLNIVVCRQFQKPFQSCARVLGSLALESVRKQKSDAAEAAPFLFGSRDELVDDHLRNVPEIAELRFP